MMVPDPDRAIRAYVYVTGLFAVGLLLVKAVVYFWP